MPDPIDPRRPRPGGSPPLPNAAVWFAAALIGALLLAAWPILTHLWWMERAGSLLDRHIVTEDAAALTEAGALLGMWPGKQGRPAPAAPPAPGSRDDAPLYWRTYGAVAARAPSEASFTLLLAARDRGRLDRLGRLWLGEVAAATGHWDVAEEVYSHIDAVNLLVDRGDDAAADGDEQAAAHWYVAAAASLAASAGASGSGGISPTRDALPDDTPNRSILLLRVGRGLLLADADDAALEVLELAESEMHANPPGIRDQQAIRFALGEALARTLPAGSDRSHPVRTRVATLMDRALEAADTGWARLQQARVLLLLGDKVEAVAALRASLRLDPDPPEAYLILGGLYEADGLDSLARNLYGDGLERNTDHPELSAAWAKASFQTMRAADALPRLERAAQTETRDPFLFAALGDCHIALGDPDAARAAYREGLRRVPGATPLRDRLAKYARPTGRTF